MPKLVKNQTKERLEVEVSAPEKSSSAALVDGLLRDLQESSARSSEHQEKFLLELVRDIVTTVRSNSVAPKENLEKIIAFAESVVVGGKMEVGKGGHDEAEGLATPRVVAKKAAEKLMQGLPSDYPGRCGAIDEMFHAFREQIAAAVEPAINEQAAQMPQATYEDKKALAKWINAETRRFALALKAPKSGVPCFLVATTGNHPTVGRFVFDYVDEHGRRQHPMSSATLPRLELIPADLSRISHGTRGAGR